MRLLLSASPSPGNLIPVLTLGRAALSAGHAVGLLTAAEMQDIADPVPVVPAGPGWDALAKENARRHPTGMGSPGAGTRLGPAEVAEFFATTRWEMGGAHALSIATEWAPDVVVAEVSDTFGPLAAAKLHRPWCSHGFGIALPDEFDASLCNASESFYRDSGVQPSRRSAYIDPWPAALQADNWMPPTDRIPIALEPLPATDESWASITTPDRYVLVTFGTQVHEPHALHDTVASVLERTSEHVVVTRGALASTGFEDDDRVTVTDFVGLGDLLRGAEVVVTVGGSGTVLSALSRAIPVVALPFFPSQRWVAERLTARGAGQVVGEPGQVGPAVARLRSSAPAMAAAGAIATSIAELGPADEALHRVLAIGERGPR